jgi:hypothetical protein
VSGSSVLLLLVTVTEYKKRCNVFNWGGGISHPLGRKFGLRFSFIHNIGKNTFLFLVKHTPSSSSSSSSSTLMD